MTDHGNLHASAELSNANQNGVPRENNVVDLLTKRRVRRKPTTEEPRFDESSVTLGMKLMLLVAISEDPELSDVSVRVANLLVLKYRNSRTGLCFPKRETLAKDCGSSASTVSRGIRELEGRKWLRIKHRNNSSNLHYFAWERLTSPEELSRMLDALVVVRSQEDYERAWADHVGPFNDEFIKHVRRVIEPADGDRIARFVDDLLTEYPKSKGKHDLYRRELPKELKKESPSQWTLNAALPRLLKAGAETKGFLPSYGDVVKVIKAEGARLTTFRERRAKMLVEETGEAQ
jgi:hypothetical protein